MIPYSELSLLNPWWEGKEDYHVRIWKSQKYKWRPEWLKEISLKSFSLNFVLGPRQVGKTTGIKLLINELKEREDPERILYLNCEIFPDPISLRKVIEEYVKEFREAYLFLDEVTSLQEWWKGIKPLIDSGLLSYSVLTVTGSSTLKLRREIELFPGRRGKGKILEVLPLSFKEYVKVHGIKAPKSSNYDKIMKLFEKYLRTGGFPGIINGAPGDEILRAYVGEIVRAGKSLEIMKEVLGAVMTVMPSATSFRALASHTSGYSYKVIQNYLEFMKDLYAVEFAHLKEGQRVLYRREKKIFFRDPLLIRLFSIWSGIRPVDSALYEAVVQEHMLRKFGEVYYYRNSYEVDVIAGELKVEVKAGKPHRRYPKGVIVLEKEEIPRFLLNL